MAKWKKCKSKVYGGEDPWARRQRLYRQKAAKVSIWKKIALFFRGK